MDTGTIPAAAPALVSPKNWPATGLHRTRIGFPLFAQGQAARPRLNRKNKTKGNANKKKRNLSLLLMPRREGATDRPATYPRGYSPTRCKLHRLGQGHRWQTNVGGATNTNDNKMPVPATTSKPVRRPARCQGQ